VGPAVQCRCDRVLKGVLGEVEVTEDTDQNRQQPAVLVTEQARERLVGGGGYPAAASAPTGMTGRISTEPVRAAGILAATSSASSSDSASIRK
jgi:hypothetical protein